MEENKPIKNFTDLNAWRESHQLVLLVYKLTRSSPKEELFGLTNQLRRATVSISSNIAEGFSRQHYSKKVQFYSMALGSNTEVQNQLLIAKDIKYINYSNYQELLHLSGIVNKLLNGLIKSSKNLLNSLFLILNSLSCLAS